MSSEAKGDIAIRVDGIGKKYKIYSDYQPTSLKEAITRRLHALFRRDDGDKKRSSGISDFWALQDVSFDVPRGEAVGIIGGNGAGKSTLLKILSRITEPTTGEAWIDGRVGSLLEVGTGFHPELSGRENIFLNGAILGMRRLEIERKFDQIVAFAEVQRFIDTPVKHYSSGMYLRLAFAVAAHLEPEILIVDEVLAVGDVDFQRKCLGRMGEVTRTGRTVLFVSHNMDAIQRLCSRCIWMDHGQLLEFGPAERVIRSYLSSKSAQALPGHAIDLSRHSRQGSGEVRFVAARYLSQNTADGTVRSGDPLRLVLTVEASAAQRIDSLAVKIDTPGGSRLINADIVRYGKSFYVEEGRHEFILDIKSIQLNAGFYPVQLTLASNGGLSITDDVERAFELWIEAAQAFSFGATPEADGFVNCEFAATLQRASEA